jgi:hypothetical protein
MDDRHRDQSREFDRRERARALIGADARAFTLSHPSAARVAGLLALEIPPTHERACAQAQTRERENTQTWRSPVSLASAMIFAILLALGLHSASRSGSLAAPAFVSPERFEARSEESAMRKNPKSFAVAAAAALSVSFTATAQDAVQWRVEDGGNGHWYQFLPVGSFVSWTAAQESARGEGGHLATLASAGELGFIETLAQCVGCPGWGPSWAIGGFQNHVAPGYAEPAGGWQWVTGEPWSYSPWASSEPNDSGGGEDFLYLHCNLHGINDGGDPTNGCVAAVFEWSADCNSDGIVDFGQILAGELDDANGNNIPDCCEAGTSCACPADITGNGNVDAADLAAVLSAWGGAPSGKENADINGDGSIDAADLAGVLSAWGPCP